MSLASPCASGLPRGGSIKRVVYKCLADIFCYKNEKWPWQLYIWISPLNEHWRKSNISNSWRKLCITVLDVSVCVYMCDVQNVDEYRMLDEIWSNSHYTLRYPKLNQKKRETLFPIVVFVYFLKFFFCLAFFMTLLWKHVSVKHVTILFGGRNKVYTFLLM